MDKRGYYVADAYRTNYLSTKPGGSTVKVHYEDHFRLYDKIKYPKAYVQKLVESDENITKIEVEGKVIWEK